MPRSFGGCTFAERPDCAAPEATIIWCAERDPSALTVSAVLAPDGADEDVFNIARLAPLLRVAVEPSGTEHAVLSDGYRHLRLDVEGGGLCDARAVLLHYRLSGIASIEPKLVSLGRLLRLARRGEFGPRPQISEVPVSRAIMLLRVRDALAAGASQREIAAALYGERIEPGWRDTADSLRSRVRRLVREARALAAGGYRRLLG